MPEQLDILQELARSDGELGMQRALERAERDHERWGEIAFEFLRRYAKAHAEFPGFFVTMASDADPSFPQPENERAWGGIWKKAVRAGVVRDSGRTMPHPKRHGCKAIVWVSLLR